MPLLSQRSSTRLQRVTLIGDHRQLPPVVKSAALRRFARFDQSLFGRLVRLGVPHVVLDQQVRSYHHCSSTTLFNTMLSLGSCASATLATLFVALSHAHRPAIAHSRRTRQRRHGATALRWQSGRHSVRTRQPGPGSRRATHRRRRVRRARRNCANAALLSEFGRSRVRGGAVHVHACRRLSGLAHFDLDHVQRTKTLDSRRSGGALCQ